MSTSNPIPTPAPLGLSIIDFLALIQHQAHAVSLTAQGLATGNPNVNPAHMIAATNRLTEIVSSWAAAVSSIPAPEGATDSEAA